MLNKGANGNDDQTDCCDRVISDRDNVSSVEGGRTIFRTRFARPEPPSADINAKVTGSVACLDDDGVVVYWSETLASLTGVNEEKMLG